MPANKVLVVEDNPDVMFVLLAAVDSQQCEFMGVEEGTSVLETMRANHPDLIIIDVMLPGMNGLEVCRKIRQDPAIAETKILGISGHISARDIEPGLFDWFLEKPFDVAILVRTMAQLLSWSAPHPLMQDGDVVLPDRDEEEEIHLTWHEGDKDKGTSHQGG